MQKWKRLDLRRRELRPKAGELVAMRMVCKISGAFSSGERYEIGRLEPDPRSSSNKLWWHTGRGSSADLAGLRPRYDIWWCPVSEFDGF